MKIKALIFFLFFSLAATSPCWSQSLYRVSVTDSAKKVRSNYRYLGFQINGLLNQIFNLGGNVSVASSPYLIVFSTNSKYTGLGFNAGLGYTVTYTDNSNPNITSTTKLSNLAARVGIEKKSYLSRKWMASLGVDLVFGRIMDDSKTSSQIQFNTVGTDIVNTTTAYGGGPRATLNYFIVPKILVGTEATYYLRLAKTSESVKDSMGNALQPASSAKANELVFQSPLVVFLIVKM